jgi:DNA-binding transcriptional MerR regulator
VAAVAMFEEVLMIGAFGSLVGLTPSALRFYDDCEVLQPASVDPATGYRLYTVQQERRVVLLRDLREIGLTLSAVRIVLDGPASASRRMTLISERHADAPRRHSTTDLRGKDAVIDWTGELLDQLDGHWTHQLRPSTDGPTDQEYLWARAGLLKCPRSWSTRQPGSDRVGPVHLRSAGPATITGTGDDDCLAHVAPDRQRARYPRRSPVRRTGGQQRRLPLRRHRG